MRPGAIPGPAAHLLRGRPSGGGGMPSILIAERDEWVSQLFAEAFLQHDWRVTTYHEGLLAAKALDGPVNYHAVLLSNRWEGVSGVNLIQQIRERDHWTHVSIVMATGALDERLVAAAMAAGADDVVQKPVELDVLVATVTKCAERRMSSMTTISDLATPETAQLMGVTA